MTRARETAWVIWVCARMQVEEMRGNHLGLVLGVVQPCVFLLVTLSAVRDDDAVEQTRWVAAVVLTSVWASTVWISGSILRGERLSGTLARSITGVQPGYIVLFGKSLGATLRNLIVIVAASTSVLLITGTRVEIRSPLWFLAGLLLSALSGVAIGMLLACALLLSSHGAEVAAALMYPVFIVGGLMIPSALLPGALHYVTVLISLSWGQKLLVGAAAGEPPALAVSMLLGLTLMYFALAVVTFARIADRARRVGDLELV